ncbi:MAG: glycosyltransferase [Methylovulum miyakonense]|uniref:glycosyltransferase n=1 Tax=Methylovulum miyakonense TaxID=645578 RepID=UPI003BB5CC80
MSNKTNDRNATINDESLAENVQDYQEKPAFFDQDSSDWIEGLKILLLDNQIDELEVSFQSILVRPEITVVDLFLIAEFFMQHDMDNMAEKAYRTILEFDNKNFAALGRLGDMALKAGDYSSAIAFFSQIIENESEPEDWAFIGLEKALQGAADLQVVELKELLESGQVDKAKRMLQSALLSPKKSSFTLFKIADIFMENGFPGLAEDTYKAILEIDGQNSAALGRLADMEHERGNYHSAVGVYRQIIENEAFPESWVYIGLGNALESIGALQDSIMCFQKAIAATKNVSDLSDLNQRVDELNKRFQEYQKGIPVQIVSNKSKASNKAFDKDLIAYDSIEAHALHFMISEATAKNLQLLRDKAAQSPEKPFIWQFLGDTAYRLGRWKESSDSYAMLATLQELNTETFYRLSDALENQHRSKEAVEAYLQGFISDPEEEKLPYLLDNILDKEPLDTGSVLALFDTVREEMPNQLSVLIDRIDSELFIKLFNETKEKDSLVKTLPFLFEKAEKTQDWSIVLVLLNVLDKANLLQSLPNWVAVDILWMAAQLQKILDISLFDDVKLKSKLYREQLVNLKKLNLWKRVIDFEKEFKLLDVERLKFKHNWKIKSGSFLLSDFFAHPESRYVSPHATFNVIWYIKTYALSPKENHPFAHFFRYSTGYLESSPNPSPYFDCDWYREQYMEENQTDNPLLHYMRYFNQTTVHPNPFFHNEYVQDVHGLLADEDPLTYYMTQLENDGVGFCISGFSPSPFFDRKFYLDNNPDILSAAKHNLDPFLHFIQNGYKEGRSAYKLQNYNQFVRHQHLYLEPFNLHSPFGAKGSLHHIKGEKAEDAYFDIQRVLVKDINYRPLISILVPVYQVKPRFLREMIDSVVAQTYDNWQLCLVDDASKRYKQEIKDIFGQYAEQDERIVFHIREKNGHICNTTNDCLGLAQGEYVALLDHDDLLTPDALYEIVIALNKNKCLDIIYTDEDKTDEWGVLSSAYYKPDWSPHSLWSRMYTCHFTAYRKTLVDEVGGFRIGYEGSQDHDLMLRCSEKSNQIHHIAKILYHWRMHEESTAGAGGEAKNYCANAALMAVQDSVTRRGLEADVSLVGNNQSMVCVKPKIKGSPLVDIIIPSRNGADILKACLKSIFEKTTYQNFKVTVVDNNSTESDFFALTENWKKKEPNRFQVIRDERTFNYAAINNQAVQNTNGDYLLFLNNDTEVITKDWIEGMLGYAQLEEVGAVGVKLYYPDDTIQHAGVVSGIRGIAGHVMSHQQKDSPGYFCNLWLTTNYSILTAACLMICRAKFDSVGGFEEYLQVAFNDVDFCLKVRRQGLYNVYLPFVELYHYESKTRGYEDTPKKQERFEHEILFMRQRWGKCLDTDPFYSPWLTVDNETMGYRFH